MQKKSQKTLATFWVLDILTLPIIRNHISDFSGLLFLSLFVGISFLLFSTGQPIFGLIGIYLLGLTGMIATPWTSIIINHQIDSSLRITTLSTIAFLTKLPYALLAIPIGILLNSNHQNILSLLTASIVFIGFFLHLLRDS